MTDTVRYGVELDGDCDHHICDCIKKAIEDKVLPASYDSGYKDCGKDIAKALPIIIRSFQAGKKQGLTDAEWIAAFSRRLLAYVESGADGIDSKVLLKTQDAPKSKKGLVN